ncbi:MAG: type IX secretion system sortase PorU [Candidatus Kapaibacterium sp.]
MIYSFRANLRIILAAILLAITSVFSATAGSDIRVISSSASSLVVEFTPRISDDPLSDIYGNDLDIPYIYGAYTEAGESFSLTVGDAIAVPSPAGFSIKNIEIEEELSGTADAPAPDLLGMPGDDFAGYKSVAKAAELEYAGIARNIYIANLKFRPVRYLPDQNKFSIAKKIRIEIAFDAAPRSTKSDVRDAFSFPVLNPDMAARWTIGRGDRTMKPAPESLTELSDGQWLKVEVKDEGIYKIDAGMLTSAGAVISAQDVSTIKIFGKGGRELPELPNRALDNDMNEQPIVVRTKSDGSLDYILFYGAPTRGFFHVGRFERYINHYSETNTYMLTWGGREGLRAEAAAHEGAVDNPAPATYVHRMFYEEELRNAFSYGSGRTWFGRSLFSAPFVNKLHNLDRSGEVNYVIYVAHRSDKRGWFEFHEDTKSLATTYLSGIDLNNYKDAYRARQAVSLPAAEIAADGRSVLKLDYNSESPSGIGFLDYYEIHYPRSFVPIENEIGFFSDPDKSGLSEFTINEFSGEEIIGFDVTDPGRPELLANRSIVGGMFTFRAEVEEDMPHRFFVASNFRKPTLRKAEMANLRGEFANTDVIVITHPDLYNSATEFKNYRIANSELSVSVVRTDHIYNEFAGGMPDLTAIRDFIAFAVEHWNNPPEYIVLWGDGHFDYKNITSDATNFIPPYETLNEDIGIYSQMNSYNIEDYIARIIGNDLTVDIRFGRMPVTSDAMGRWLVEKIDHYENKSNIDLWRTRITLVADDGITKNNDTDHQTHTTDSEELARDHVENDFLQNKIYIVEYPTENVPDGRRKPRAREDLISSVNTRGALILSWIGHGNPRVWSHEEIFDRGISIPQMTNLDKLFFTTAATCDFGRFDHPDVQCGAEELVNSQAGGSIGVFSASRLVTSISNMFITTSFYDCMFTRDSVTGKYPRLGDVMYYTKIKNNGSGNDEKFFLLGDPTMRLLIPENVIAIDSINGISVADSEEPLELKGLSEVVISGRVLDPMGNALDATFDGTALITMLDGDEPISVVDPKGDEFKYVKFGSALNRTSTTVADGRFTASFIIPKDISFSEAAGRLFAYAFTENGRYAKGSCRNFVVNGVDPTSVSDDKGPEIEIFMDSREFRPGDVVREDPMLIVDLFDESGINSTGRGIGHKIEAWIDDAPTPIDLTDKFNLSLYDPRNGWVEEILFNIEPGIHTIKVRAWDVFNNYSTAETYFRVAPENSLSIANIDCYPNPFENATTVRFRHNIAPPLEVDLYIYNYLGEQIRRIEGNVGTALLSEIEWDGLDSQGRRVGPGTYLLRVRAQSLSGGGFAEAGTLSVTVK